MAIAPYDVKINGVGYMADIKQGGPVTPTDLQPGTARSADGEADFIRFEADSAHQITDFSGGAGQRRHVSTNRWLTGLGNGAFGPFYPPYTQLTESGTAGTTSWYFRRGSTLYGKTSTNIEEIGTSTTTSATGTPDQAPVQTPAGNIYWTSGGVLRRWDGTTVVTRGGSSSTDPLPSPEFAVNGAAVFGRHLFAWAERKATTQPAIRQITSTTFDSQIATLAWDEPTIPGNVLLAVVITSLSTRMVPDDSEWRPIASVGSGNLPRYTVDTFAIERSQGFRKSSEIFQTPEPTTSNLSGVLWLIEIENVHDGEFSDWLFDVSTNRDVNTDSVSTGSISEPSQGGFALSIMGAIDDTDDPDPIGHDTGWSEDEEVAVGGTNFFLRAAIAHEASPDATESDSTTLGSSQDHTFGIGLMFSAYSVAQSREIILATANDGESWLLAPTNFTSQVLGTPRAFLPWSGFLWFTTEFGMYRLRYGEDEYLAGNQTVNLAIEQIAEFRGLPSSDNAGKWLEVYDNGIYTGIGEALYRYTEGGGFEPVFPTEDWATVGGEIRAIVRAGRQLFFGAGNYLWMFTGRSFHPVATPTAASDMDYMAYHDGKLYLNDDPATYFNIGNPSLRPDLNDDTAASYETGYYISSRLDFHKVNVLKVISEFEEQVRFTQGANTGTVTWAYRSADGDTQDPGQSGGSGGSGWTTITTHSKGDTSPKSTDLNPEIEVRALWLRATLTPGSSGYPYIEYVSPIGRAIPPVQRRFTIPIMLKVGLRDREGTEIYSSQSDIETAIDNLQALRDPSQSPNAVDLLWEDESTAGETVRGTVVAVSPARLVSREPEGSYYRVSVSFDQLP